MTTSSYEACSTIESQVSILAEPSFEEIAPPVFVVPRRLRRRSDAGLHLLSDTDREFEIGGSRIAEGESALVRVVQDDNEETAASSECHDHPQPAVRILSPRSCRCWRFALCRALSYSGVGLLFLFGILLAVALCARQNARLHYEILSSTLRTADISACTSSPALCRQALGFDSTADSPAALHSAGDRPARYPAVLQMLQQGLDGTFFITVTPDQAQRCDLLPPETVFLGTVLQMLVNVPVSASTDALPNNTATVDVKVDSHVDLMEEILSGAHIVVQYGPEDAPRIGEPISRSRSHFVQS